MEVKIVRTIRRRRTVSGRIIKDTLLVRAPAGLSQESLDKVIDNFKLKFARKRIKAELEEKDNLIDLASSLNGQYFGNKLKIESIEYVTTQNSRFGCCNYRTARIRISHKIGLMPEWVRRYVVMHEMAHLIEPNHSGAFWEVCSRYKLTERARGYLMAAGLDKAS